MSDKKALHGGRFNGLAVADRDEDKLWITVYEIDGKQYIPTPGMNYKNFPVGVMRHGYRKQKDGQFHFVWTRANDDE